MKFECPECKKEFDVQAAAAMPDDQRIVMELSREEGFFSAGTIGGCISGNEKLLKAVAKEMGCAVSVFVIGMKLTEKMVSIEFLVAQNRKQPKKARAAK